MSNCYNKLNKKRNGTPLNIDGVWNSNYGRYIFEQGGTKIRGTFDYKHGYFLNYFKI